MPPPEPITISVPRSPIAFGTIDGVIPPDAMGKLGFRWWYYFTVIFLTIVTSITMVLTQPGTLILICGIANFFAMAIYCPALIIMNYYILPKKFPKWVKPSLISAQYDKKY